MLITLASALVLCALLLAPAARAQQTPRQPRQPLEQLPDGIYHAGFFKWDSPFVFSVGMTQKSANFVKKGNVITGGAHWMRFNPATEEFALHVVCFKGKLKGNVVVNDRAFFNNPVRGALPEVPQIDFGEYAVSALSEEQAAYSLIATCADLNQLFDIAEETENAGFDFWEGVEKILTTTSVGAGASLGLDFAGVKLTREHYWRQIRKATNEILIEAVQGRTSLDAGARKLFDLRNAIRESARARDSAYGRALAQLMGKPRGEFASYRDGVARQKYGKLFARLTEAEKAAISWQIMLGGLKTRPEADDMARGFGMAGKVLLGVTFIASLYTIVSAEDKVAAAEEAGAAAGGGVAGGRLAGWAGARLFCLGLTVGAPACVLISTVIGAALGAWGGEEFLQEWRRVEPD